MPLLGHSHQHMAVSYSGEDISALPVLQSCSFGQVLCDATRAALDLGHAHRLYI